MFWHERYFLVLFPAICPWNMHFSLLYHCPRLILNVNYHAIYSVWWIHKGIIKLFFTPNFADFCLQIKIKLVAVCQILWSLTILHTLRCYWRYVITFEGLTFVWILNPMSQFCAIFFCNWPYIIPYVRVYFNSSISHSSTY